MHFTDDNLCCLFCGTRLLIDYRRKYVGDIKDWSLKELFEYLLRAEARVEEPDHHSKSGLTKQSPRNAVAVMEDDVLVNVPPKKFTTPRRT